jgi:hypothetical protein
MWWKKKDKNKEEKEEKKGVIEEKKEESVLKELCGDDVKLYDFLSHYLYENPFTAISEKELNTLTEEAEKSGNFLPAMDKAIFESAQNPGERERYIKVIQNLASKTLHKAEQEKEKAEKEGNTGWAASLERRIEDQKFLNERTENIINVASEFYKEKLMELGEDVKRKARAEERRQSERDEWRIGEREEAEREARKKEEKMMGRDERREAEKQDKREELAAAERKEARAEERRKAEREERRIKEQEEAEREERKGERGN